MSSRTPLQRIQTFHNERFHTNRRQLPDLASLASVTGPIFRFRVQNTPAFPETSLRSNLQVADLTAVSILELQASMQTGGI